MNAFYNLDPESLEYLKEPPLPAETPEN